MWGLAARRELVGAEGLLVARGERGGDLVGGELEARDGDGLDTCNL